MPDQNQTPKHILDSRTVKVSLGKVLAAWAGYASGALPIEAAITATIFEVVNIGMRCITSQPVTLSKEGS